MKKALVIAAITYHVIIVDPRRKKMVAVGLSGPY